MNYQTFMVGPGAKLEVANLFIEGKPGHIHLKLKIVCIDQKEKKNQIISVQDEIKIEFDLPTLHVDWKMPGGICSTVPSLYTINELEKNYQVVSIFFS